MNKINTYLILIGLLFTQTIFGQTNITTDRPDQTESAVVIPKKSFQLESGFTFTFANNTRQISTPNTLVRYGLFSFLELRLFNEVKIDKASGLDKQVGLSDLQFGLKAHLIQSKDGKSNLALLSHVIAPSGSTAFSSNSWGNVSKILVSHSLNDKTSLGLNVGYQYLNSTKGDLLYTLSCAHSVTDRLGLYLELYGDVAEFEQFNINSDAGLTYLVKPNFQVDASYGMGLNQRFNFLSFGFCWNVAPSVSPASN